MEQVQFFLTENTVWWMAIGMMILLFFQMSILQKISKLNRRIEKEWTNQNTELDLQTEATDSTEELNLEMAVDSVEAELLLPQGEDSLTEEKIGQPTSETIIEEVLAEIFSY